MLRTLVLLCIAVIAVLALRIGLRAPPSADTAGARESATTRRAVTSSEAAPEVRPSSFDDTHAAEPTEDERRDATRSRDRLVLEGTLAVTERDGRITHDEAGFVSLYLSDGDERIAVGAALREGAWRLEFELLESGSYQQVSSTSEQFGPDVAASLASMHVESFTVMGIAARGLLEPLRAEGGRTFGEEPLVLHARRRRPFLLHVRDAETGTPLENVCVVEGSRPDYDGREMAAEWYKRTNCPCDSPVELARSRSSPRTGPVHATYVISAPGYATRIWQLTTREDEEGEVLLHRGADLELVLTGPPPPRSARLELVVNDDTWTTELGSSPIRLRGLEPGPVGVRIVSGTGWDETVVSADATVTLRAGELTTLELACEAPPEHAFASASGLVIVPEGWGALARRIVLDLRGTPLDGGSGHHVVRLPDELVGGSHAFELADLQTGTYRLSVEPLGYGLEFELPEHGRGDLRLVLPPPVTFAVRVVEGSGDAAAVSTLTWSHTPPGDLAVVSGTVRRSDVDGAFRVTAPDGWLRLRANSARYECDPLSLRPRAGEVVELRVRRAR